MSAYYYLISSLPVLDREHVPATLDCDEQIAHIRQNLDVQDLGVFKALFYPGDIRNWVNLLASRRKLPDLYPLVYDIGSLSREALLNPVQYSGEWPSFMMKFHEDAGENIEDMGLPEIEANLIELFYEEVLGMGNEFLSSFSSRDRSLRNIIVACNARRYGAQLQSNLIGDTPENWQLQHSKSADFGISLEYPYIDDILETLEQEDPIALEHLADRLRWDFIDELLSFHHFDLPVVLGYVLKLLMIRRWQMLKEYSAEHKPLQRLKESILRDFVLPETDKK